MPGFAALAVVLLMLLAGLGLGCDTGWPLESLGCTTAPDQYEPNDELQSATNLPPGSTLSATIDRAGPRGDVDIFQSPAPGPGGAVRFRVEIEGDRSQYLKVDVGASIPTAWEGITWPGWQPVRAGTTITVQGELQVGTVLVIVSGERTAEYSIRIVWE